MHCTWYKDISDLVLLIPCHFAHIYFGPCPFWPLPIFELSFSALNLGQFQTLSFNIFFTY